MLSFSLLSAFLLGLLGSTHCFAMCSGIAGILQSTAQSGHNKLTMQIAYNFGRILTYSIIGFITALFGSSLLDVFNPFASKRISQMITGSFTIALGLYIGNWWFGLNYFERLGRILWNKIRPIGHRFIPITNPFIAIGAGLIWGWLPCGLVYSALVWTLSLENGLEGFLFMFTFGVGTLPALLISGSGAGLLKSISNAKYTRNIVGALLVIFGAAMFLGIPQKLMVHSH